VAIEVNKRLATQNLKWNDLFNLKNLSEMEVRKQYHIEIPKSFTGLQNLSYNEDIDKSLGKIKEII
jgi:hypothetical protein